MNAAENDAADAHGAESGPALTGELLADLQAGVLDDDNAARVRRQVRADPHASRVLGALNQVRHDVAAVGADPDSGPAPPPQLTAKISAALRSADPLRGGAANDAAHSVRPHIRPARVVAAVVGVGAVLAAIGVGTIALLRTPELPTGTPDFVEHITVSTPPMQIPLSRNEILNLVDHDPDYGPFSDPARRASCLAGLGYPASTQVLGARPVEINARPGVVLVIPGDTPRSLAVYAVALNCSAADTGLLATTAIPRP